MALHERIAVIGAGVSGLTAAHALTRAGYDVTVIDQSAVVGGRVHSEAIGGYLLEHGANALVSPAPIADALIEGLALDRERIQRGSEVRHRYLVRNGRVRALSIDPFGFFSSNFFTLYGRLRLLAEPFAPAIAGDETIADFVIRRFGRELLDYVFDPLVGGLYAGDPRQLGVKSVFPHLKRLEHEHGSVIRGAIKARNSGDRSFSPRNRQLFSFRAGLATLPRALEQTLGNRLALDTKVLRIEPCAGGSFRLHLRDKHHSSTLTASSVILAVPAYAAAPLLAPLDTRTGGALAALQHPPIAVVFLGYARNAVLHPLDGLGVLTPNRERRDVLGLIFSSTLFAERAPRNQVLLTAYVGGARQPELASLGPGTLIALVAKEARELLGARGAPDFARVRYWRHGLPQPGVGHTDVIAGIRLFEERWRGIFITGNYLGGVSTGACIDEATLTAGRVMRHLTEREQAPLSDGLLRVHER
jgi:oxygen-dependent protoporphyrinogen oxidase